MFYYCLGLFAFVKYGFSIENEKYLTLRCKDNENEPVDWWIIYKPPLSDSPDFSQGGNFTFLRDGDLRWQKSESTIDLDSMLLHTLAPLYEVKRDKIAWLVSDETDFTSSHAVMMADEVSGVLLEHSIPGFPDLDAPSMTFPYTELHKGHYMMCLSLDLSTINILATVLKEIKPKVLIHVPLHLEGKLPFWKYFDRTDMRNLMSFKSDAMDFMTKDNTAPVHIMLRRPNGEGCLFKRFAEKKKSIIDVYNHDKRVKNFCSINHGVRRQNSISLKYPEEVHYITNTSEKFSFGVTTAAHWQRTGAERNQYWACLSTVEREDSTLKGGLLLCLNSYRVWWSFTNLKVNEPEC